jgi:hypothetical protein
MNGRSGRLAQARQRQRHRLHDGDEMTVGVGAGTVMSASAWISPGIYAMLAASLDAYDNDGCRERSLLVPV